jgi:hypothetical protein
MAWRIDESVIRGEIDNRTRDRVTGRIWFAGLAEPVELALEGNAWRDLAGRRLEFVNPVAVKPPLSAAAGFAQRQSGVIGDCTASRKVKVPEVTMEELIANSTGSENRFRGTGATACISSGSARRTDAW